MFPRGPAIELVDPDLLAAQVVRVPRVVLDVKPEIGRALLGLLHRGESREETGEGGKRRWLEMVMAQVLTVMCAVAFMGASKKKRNLWLWHFNVSRLAFNLHILFVLPLRADNYVMRRVNEVSV